jgi:hypothetical protein
MQLQYTYFDVDNDPEGNSSIRWYKNDHKLQTAYNGRIVVPANTASRGEQWYATVQVHDGIYPGTVVTTSKVTINRLPRAISVTIVPTQPHACQKLYLDHFFEDDDEEDLEGKPRTRWYCNGEHLSYYDNWEYLPASAITANQHYSATLFPYDGLEYGRGVKADKVFIAACPPVSINLPIVLRNYPQTHCNPSSFYEENDTQKDACRLNFGQTYESYPDDTDDWYYVLLTQTASLHVLVTNYSPNQVEKGSGQLAVYDSERESIGNDGHGLPQMEIPNAGNPNALKNLPPGLYYIRVYTIKNLSKEIPYYLTVTKQ